MSDTAAVRCVLTKEIEEIFPNRRNYWILFTFYRGKRTIFKECRILLLLIIIINQKANLFEAEPLKLPSFWPFSENY